MILVLNGADFSAKNIGNINIPEELSDFTKAAITASGNSSLNEQKKYALNSFFRSVGALNNTGIWQKVRKCYIPALCSDLSYAMINYKGNEKDIELNDKYMLEACGIKPASNERSYQEFPITLASNNNLSFAYGTTTKIASNASFGLIRFNSATYSQLARTSANGINVSTKGINTPVVVGGAADSQPPFSVVITFDGENSKMKTTAKTVSKGEVFEVQDASFDVTDNVSYEPLLSSSGVMRTTDSPIGFMLFADKLTDAEMATLRDLIDELINVLVN